MFDGILPLDEYEPQRQAIPAASALPWGLVVLVLAMTSLAILAAVLFPDALSYPGDHF
jgi:hypothetical protein